MLSNTDAPFGKRAWPRQPRHRSGPRAGSYDAVVQPPESAFSISLTVQAGDLDEFDHVNNVVYVRWVQDVAAAHWEHIAPESMRAAIFWVVVRHEIDYLRPALLGDELVVRTWLGPRVDGLFERFTHISRTKKSATTTYGGVTLVRGRTIWCPIDSSNGRRLRKLPHDAERLFVGLN